MNITLTTWERIICFNAVSSLRGLDAGGMRKAAKLLDIVELNEDEKKAIGFVLFPDGTANWNEKANNDWGIVIADGNLVEFLKQAIQKPDIVVTGKAREMVRLFDKFGIAPEEKS